jgi:hypothetical protein
MPLAITPTSALVTPNKRVNFRASGGTAPYTYAITSNLSGGSIDATGHYLAGPHGLVVDQVTVTDAAAATAVATVQVTAGLWQKTQQNLGPPSTKLPNAQVVEGEYGAEKDVEAERARQGMLTALPGLTPVDALPFIAQERQIPKAASDTDATWAEALRTAWDAHARNTSHRRILEALDRAGFPMGDPAGAHVMQRFKRYTWLTSSGGSFAEGTHPPWTFDPTAPRWMWNQFGIIFGADVPGLTVGSPMADLLNETIDSLQPADGNFMGTWIIVSGPTWGWPVGTTWGQVGRNWGGGVTRYIPPL